MNLIPETAKSFSEALKLGAVALEDIIQWADTVIVKENEPSIEVIELALCKKESDALKYLSSMASSADEEMSYRILFGLLYDALLHERSRYIDVAKRLYFWSAYEKNIEGYGELIRYWDAIQLAESGAHGDPAIIKKELLDFLYAKKA